MEKTIKELDFYLVELHEGDPWVYAKYHCGAAANVYSSIQLEFLVWKRDLQSQKLIPGEPESDVATERRIQIGKRVLFTKLLGG